MKVRKFNEIPADIKSLGQWVGWRAVEEPRTEKPRKVPINPLTGELAKVNKSATWGTYQAAKRAQRKWKLTGIGFVLTEEDPYVVIDLDHCRDSKTGEIEPWAKKIIDQVRSYTEVSPSGMGAHIWVRGKLPPGGRKKGNIEVYDSARYMTVTGQHIPGTPKRIRSLPKTLKRFHAEVFGDAPSVSRFQAPVAEAFASDEELIERIKRGQAGRKCAALWAGDEVGHSSKSEGDLALCSYLVRLVGANLVQVDRLFRCSDRMRKKWDEAHSSSGRTYGEMTIHKAIEGVGGHQATMTLDEAKELAGRALVAAEANPTHALGNILEDAKAVEALATLRNHVVAEYESFCLKIREAAGLTARNVETLKRVVSREAKSLKAALPRPERSALLHAELKATVPNAPVPDSVMMPHGFRVDATGLYQFKRKAEGGDGWVCISPTPFIIQAKAKNRNTNNEIVRLAWADADAWRTITVSRGEIADDKRIVGLADKGAPVNSVTARSLVEFFAAFEALNCDLPQTVTTSHLGWVGSSDRPGFLWGRNLVLPDGEVIMEAQVEKLPPDQWPEGLAFFEPPDDGDAQLAGAFRAQGSLKAWLKAMKLVRRYPVVNFAVLASLAAPLLHILNAPNIIVDLSCETSTGKTTALKVAASVWGNPDDRSPSPLVRSWDATRVYVERSAGLLHSLPLLLDETKRAKDPRQVSQFLYDYAQGQGKGRGSIKGTRGSSTWRGVLISTGENKAVDFAAGDGGAHARVISIAGKPLGKATPNKTRRIARLMSILESNYGHAGLLFLQYLISKRKRWPKWQKRYQNFRREYEQEAGTNSVALRQASYFAAIRLAGFLANKVLALPFDVEAHISEVYNLAVVEVAAADRPREALALVYAWAVQYQARFWGRGNEDKTPAQGWLGAWPNINWSRSTREIIRANRGCDGIPSDDNGDNWYYIAYLPHKLEDYLRQKGFEPKSTIRAWKERGWLDVNGEAKGNQKKVAVGNERTRCVVVRRAAIESLDK